MWGEWICPSQQSACSPWAVRAVCPQAAFWLRVQIHRLGHECLCVSVRVHASVCKGVFLSVCEYMYVSVCFVYMCVCVLLAGPCSLPWTRLRGVSW